MLILVIYQNIKKIIIKTKQKMETIVNITNMQMEELHRREKRKIYITKVKIIIIYIKRRLNHQEQQPEACFLFF